MTTSRFSVDDLGLAAAAILAILIALTGLLGCAAEPEGPPPNNPYVPIPKPIPTPLPGSLTDVSGDIAADVTWDAGIRITADVTVLPGVTVTVAPGSSVVATEGVLLLVQGSLVVAGTQAEPVSFAPENAGGAWVGIEVDTGGSADISWTDAEGADIVLDCQSGAVSCDLTSVHFHDSGKAAEYRAPGDVSYSTFSFIGNAGFSVRNGADLLISDSVFFESSHDIVVVSGGSIAMDHVEVGFVETYEHCEIHVNSADSFSLTNSVIHGSVYGIMLGGTDSALINYNNFDNNGTDIWDLGGATNADLRYNWWENGAPPVGNGSIPGMVPPEYDTSSPAASPYPDAGPRK